MINPVINYFFFWTSILHPTAIRGYIHVYYVPDHIRAFGAKHLLAGEEPELLKDKQSTSFELRSLQIVIPSHHNTVLLPHMEPLRSNTLSKSIQKYLN